MSATLEKAGFGRHGGVDLVADSAGAISLTQPAQSFSVYGVGP